MDLAPNTSAALAVVALGAGVLAVATDMGAQTRLSRIEARYSEVTLSPEEQQVVTAARTERGGS